MSKAKNNNIVDLTGRRRNERERVLEQLFNEHGAALQSFIGRNMAADADSEDIVQEVFIRLAKVEALCDKIKEEAGSTRSYLFTIANNLVVDMERKKSRRRGFDSRVREEVEDTVVENNPEVIVSASRELEMMKSVIMKLKTEWRRAFVLNRFKHMSYPQVAQHMGVTVKQVEHFIAQALVQIRRARRLARDEGK